MWDNGREKELPEGERGEGNLGPKIGEVMEKHTTSRDIGE